MTDRKVERRHREAAAAAVKPDWRRSDVLEGETLALLQRIAQALAAAEAAAAARAVEPFALLMKKASETEAVESALTAATAKHAEELAKLIERAGYAAGLHFDEPTADTLVAGLEHVINERDEWQKKAQEELAKLRTKHDEMKAGAVALAATLGPRIVELEEQLKAKETELRATEDALTSARDKLAGLAKESAQKYGITASFNDLCGRHYELERAVFDGDGPDDQKPDERNATAIAAVHSLREQLAKAQGELERRHQNHARLEHERCALRDLIREFSDYCKDSGWHNLGEELMRRRDALLVRQTNGSRRRGESGTSVSFRHRAREAQEVAVMLKVLNYQTKEWGERPPFDREFLEHAVQTGSQYDSTCRRMAAQILAIESELAELRKREKALESLLGLVSEEDGTVVFRVLDGGQRHCQARLIAAQGDDALRAALACWERQP